MAYNWPGMRKIPWDEVKELIKNNEIVGCFKLYEDGTEGMIESGYDLDDLYRHHDAGGEFGEEIADEMTTEYCPWCNEEVEIRSIGPQICPNCKKVILPCSTCPDHNCTNCGYEEEESYKVARNKEDNDKYWKEIDELTKEYVRKIAEKSVIAKVDPDLNGYLHEIIGIVTLTTVRELKFIGGVYPTLDEYE